MDAFLLWIDENDDARQALDERIISYPGAKEEITEKVLIPLENQADVAEMDHEITEGLEIIGVSTMEEVLRQALAPKDNH